MIEHAATSQRTVLLLRGGARESAALSWSRDGDSYHVTLDHSTGPLTGHGRDLFDAFADLRRHLEPRNWAVAVNGARRDTYPSGMARDMGGARRVYILQLGHPASRENLVNIFGDADPALLGTVAQQQQHYTDWLRSIRTDRT
jgi:hypothetical protein